MLAFRWYHDDYHEMCTRYVAGGGIDALKVPDRLGGPGKVLRQEAAAVVAVEQAREAPLVAWWIMRCCQCQMSGLQMRACAPRLLPPYAAGSGWTRFSC